MLKNIIFDFGDVFINLDKSAPSGALNQYNVKELPEKFHENCRLYEMGEISTEYFIHQATTGFNVSKGEFVNAWNAILKDFPMHRLEFLKKISKEYRCFLLSNTNELHINWIKNDWGEGLFGEFENCFEQFYLSQELGMRKPNLDIYEYVMSENNLLPEETLFIDDTSENTDSAAKLGILVWNINPKTEDISELKTNKPELF